MGDAAGRSAVTVVLDTCAIVWAIGDPGRLPDAVAGILTADDTRVCVSAVSCAEIACASQRGRIDIDRHWRRWFRHYVELNGWTVLPLDLDTVEEAYALPDPFHRDPADRLIVAAARGLSAPVVTADARILDYPHVKTLWKG
ncbi:MAG: type II toxin-antitoxin system VapC family toxin [Acidobacteria bacterium]|nr:type II toxin-antitoxin system VapC family toxin [Acidobacteriota bacterium]MYH28917.1 type II toxin-antitoxin system VapC family toxin [Acidobacteriota bacterium]MYK89960.1 type II toxin-antitoxin system VapC family toxin [Acidobacteriota bacterium]